jgi:hypothetical protein
MEHYNCLLSRNIYKYDFKIRSLVTLERYYNICFISSFYNGLKQIYPNIPTLEEFIPNIYINLNNKNLYTDFAGDFCNKWKIIREFLKAYNLDDTNFILSIWMPLKNKRCVNIVNIDLDRYNENISESFLEDDSYEKEIREDLLIKNKKIINIIQFDNHFDSIIIENKVNDKYNDLQKFINNLDIDKNFFD